MVFLAANLLEQVTPPEKLPALVERLYRHGRGLTLWPAAYFATLLEPADAVALTMARLRETLVPGCEHLFDALGDLVMAPTPDVLAILEHGLLSGDRKTAMAAATLAGKLATPGDGDLLNVLQRAYGYWQERDAPYLEKGDRIPPTPRENLLPVLLTLHAPSLESLLEYATDRHHDIAKAGGDALDRRLQESAEARHWFVTAVLDRTAPANLLRHALRVGVPFEPDAVRRLTELFRDADPRRRFAALGLLDRAYLPPEDIEQLCRPLFGDDEVEIRDAALRALERLTVS